MLPPQLGMQGGLRAAGGEVFAQPRDAITIKVDISGLSSPVQAMQPVQAIQPVQSMQPVQIHPTKFYGQEAVQRYTAITKAIDLPLRIREKIKKVRGLETDLQELGKKKLEDGKEIVEEEGEDREKISNQV